MTRRRDMWTPPSRPEWVSKVNEEGRYLDIRGIVPLDPESLIATAKRNTGLSDFGEDDWIEPFRIYVQSVDEDGDLNLMGRIMTRSELLMMLEGRLRVEEAYKQHPEIEDEVIAQPILIVGQGRTGTSMLVNLLSLDPDNATLRTWEAMMPAPPPEKENYFSDPRIEICDRRISMYDRITPEIRSMHEFTGLIPTENIHLEAMSFYGYAWLDMLGQAPRYLEWMRGRSYAPALSWLKRVLKVLQWHNPRKRWILKSPDALNYLPEVFASFPDLALVWTHRDPVIALKSMVNLVGTLVWMRSDKVISDGAFEQVADVKNAARMITQPIDWMESGVVPKNRLYDVHYGDLISEPLAVVEGLYRHFGFELTHTTRQAIVDYLIENPREARPKNVYRTGDEFVSEERQAFARYQEYFRVPSEG